MERYCYIIAEGFFFILSFFVGYILSFGLVRLWSVRLLVQVFTHGGCDNHKCHNKKTQIGNRAWVWITSFPEAMGWEFWWILKKAVSWDLKLGVASPVCGLRDARAFVGSVSWDFDSGPRVQLGLTEEWFRNSQHSKNCVSLSLCGKNKLKKWINVSYLN